MPPNSKPKYHERFNLAVFKRPFQKKQSPGPKPPDEDVPNTDSPSSSASTEATRPSVQNTHSIQEPAIDTTFLVTQASDQDTVSPWKEWKVDDTGNFLQKLNRWNQDHQDQTLRKVLDKVNTVLESSVFEAALRFIPDNPFPAATLVESLLNLVLLGTKMPETKEKVSDFTVTVVTDVTHMAEAFGTNPVTGDSIMVQCWNDLDPYRNLVNEICEWANKKLTSNTTFAESTQEEVNEFEKRLESTKSMFLTLSTIRVVRGIADLGQGVFKLLEYHRRKDRMDAIKDALSSRLAENAQYEHQDKTECDEVTRGDVLAQIDRWVRTPSDTEHCWWITGKPAVGKSAIGITVAQCLKDRQPIQAMRGDGHDTVLEDGGETESEDDGFGSGWIVGQSEIESEDDEFGGGWIVGQPIEAKHAGTEVSRLHKAALYGQFFINHRYASTTDPNRIFPTLALQLASSSPAAAVIIQKAVTTKRTVVEKFSKEQARLLFVDPLSAIARHECDMVAIVIDGVDELTTAAESDLNLVTSVLCAAMSLLPSNVKILIFSRPDTPIVSCIPSSIKRFDLDTKKSKQDVERLLRKELQRIAEAPNRRWQAWPSEMQLKQLIVLANGHLGWTKTALRWIERRLEEVFADQKDRVLEEVEDLGTGDLDTLYGAILCKAFVLDEVIVVAQQVLGCLAVLEQPLSISTISTLLALPESRVLHIFEKISSVIVRGIDAVTLATVPRPHKSFIDYVTERAQSPFRINIEDHHHDLATACFRIMLDRSQLHFNMANRVTSDHRTRESSSIIKAHVTYACSTFAHHLQGAIQTTAFHNMIDEFIKNQFLFWFEVMCLYPAGHMLWSLRDQVEVTFPDSNLVALIKDAVDFEQLARDIRDGPHIYLSALPFAASKLSLMKHYLQCYPHTLRVKQLEEALPVALPKWKEISSAELSPNGTYIMAVFSTHPHIESSVVCVFNTATGQLHWQKATKRVYSISFSFDEIYVASGGDSLQVWNVKTGEEERQWQLENLGNNDYISALTFAPDSMHIVVGYSKGLVLTWSLESGEPTAILKHPCQDKCPCKVDVFMHPRLYHPCQVTSVAYSGNGRQIIAASKGHPLLIWPPLSQTVTSTFDDYYPESFRISDDEVVVRLHQTDSPSTVQLVNASTGEYHTLDGIWSTEKILALSPNGRFLVSVTTVISYNVPIGPGDLGIHIWDITPRTECKMIGSLVGHAESVESVAFFADGDHIMSASRDNTIRIWDITSLLSQKSGEGMDCWAHYPLDPGYRRSVIYGPDPDRNSLFHAIYPFRHPRNTLVIGQCVDIDFTNFVHGEDWVKCREPLEKEGDEVTKAS